MHNDNNGCGSLEQQVDAASLLISVVERSCQDGDGRSPHTERRVAPHIIFIYLYMQPMVRGNAKVFLGNAEVILKKKSQCALQVQEQLSHITLVRIQPLQNKSPC